MLFHKPADYKEKFIAYVDILGFKNLVLKHSAEEIQDIFINIFLAHRFNKFLYSFQKNECKQIKNGNFDKIKLQDTNLTVISDTIIITCKCDYKVFFRLFKTIKILQISLLKELSVFWRGSLHIGKVFHKKNIVFGPGIVEAYKSELNAIYPRIILTNELIQYLKTKGIYGSLLKKKFILNDTDNYKFINYFIFDDNPQKEILKLKNGKLTNIPVHLNAIRRNVKSELNSVMLNNKEHKKIRTKLYWILSFCDMYLKYYLPLRPTKK